ncbi:MAG: VWA domain-containing protein, partial [Phycisphaerales bacterium]|nr:VWA domain-containing protein [Phycisphaerales bacterium]
MNFAFQEPFWLVLLIVIAPSVWIGWRWMSSVPRGRRVLAIAMRCVLIALIALTLAGLERVQETDRVAVVAVLDVSGSIRSYADFGVDDLGMPVDVERGYRSFLARAAVDMKPDDLLGVVVFDGQPSGIALPSQGGVLDRIVRMPASSGTDIGSALVRARAMLPADVNGRIVLVSDGRSTAGDLSAIGDSVPIDVVPIEYEIINEVVVESVQLPARALPESVVDVAVVLRSGSTARGVLRVDYNGEPVDINLDTAGNGLKIELRRGRQVVHVAVQLGASRVHRVRARFEPEASTDDFGNRALVGDTSEENNNAGGITITSGHGRILVVDGVSNAEDTGAGTILPETLGRGQWDVR